MATRKAPAKKPKTVATPSGPLATKPSSFKEPFEQQVVADKDPKCKRCGKVKADHTSRKRRDGSVTHYCTLWRSEQKFDG